MADQKHMGEEMLQHFKIPEGGVLETVMSLQYAFGGRFVDFNSILEGCRTYNSDAEYQRRVWVRKFLDCMFDETSEVLEWLPWKHWKSYKDFELNPREIKFELIDMLHFIAEIWILNQVNISLIYSRMSVGQERVNSLKEALEYTKKYYLKGLRIATVDGVVDWTDDIAQTTIHLLRELITEIGEQYVCPESERITVNMTNTLLKLFVVWEMSESDIWDFFYSKNKENIDRQRRGY